MILLSRAEEIVLLAIWKLNDNAYGVTIRELISQETGHEWTFGAIYKPLKKLTFKNYVRKRPSGPSAVRGGRSKYLYSLTTEGEEALRTIRRIHEAVWTEETKLAFE